jgi:hypothetical protein
MLKKKIWANFQRIIELFTQNIATNPSKIWVWDPGSGIRKKTYSGSRGQKGTRSGSATLIRGITEGTLYNIVLRMHTATASVADPDPDLPDPPVLGPPGSGSGSTG